jgi:2-hydroxy-6-oxonona-2,4-dienedioate hydrolase
MSMRQFSRCFHNAPMNEIELPAAAQALLREAARRETPCGDGVAVWHLWGEGEPVVMLHGGSGSWTHWVRNIAAVVAAGRMAVVPDLPGFGDSAAPPGGGDADAAVAPVADGLRTLLGERPSTVLAFSFGSLVAALLAAQQPRLVSKLLLVGAPVVALRRGRGVDLRPWSRSSSAAERNAVHRHNLAAIMLHRPESIDDEALALHALNVPRDRLRRRNLVTTNAFADAIPQLACRYRAIYGAEDVLCRGSWPAIQRALETTPRFDGLTLVPDAGHWVQFEAAERFNAWLVDALAAGSASGR